ncbi:MAG: AEC family transporter [Synergistaceae bacterium]|nr:AEC family transporter [Synergistaceae bacterium]
MSESFVAALKVVCPMMIMMAVGWLCRVKGVISRPAMKEYDRVIFNVFMPLLLFKNIYEMDFSGGFAHKEMIYAGVCLFVIFALCMRMPAYLTDDPRKSCVIGQAVVRCNYIIFGVAVSEALYGEGNIGMVVMLGVVVVPAINIFSAIILEAGRSGKSSPGKLLLAVLKNPMIIGAIFAFVFKAFNIPIAAPVWSVIRSIANSTTTVSFLSLGVGLDMAGGVSDKRLLHWGIFLRMLIVPLMFMPVSVLMGFRGQSLCAMMVVFASPSAVASYPMAVAMGADGQLAGQLVCVTTVLSVLTIFLWTFGLKSLGLM